MSMPSLQWNPISRCVIEKRDKRRPLTVQGMVCRASVGYRRPSRQFDGSKVGPAESWVRESPAPSPLFDLKHPLRNHGDNVLGSQNPFLGGLGALQQGSIFAGRGRGGQG
jgi:hypothetical protein